MSSHDVPSSSATSATLLERLRDSDDRAAWEEFFARYADRIYRWTLKCGLQEADCQDIVTNVVMKVVTQTRQRGWKYDPRSGKFRGYLWTTTRNAIRTLLKDRKKMSASGERHTYETLQHLQDKVDTLRTVIAGEVLRLLCDHVEASVASDHWRIFAMRHFDQLSYKEIADLTNKQIVNVRTIVCRVRSKFRQAGREFGIQDDFPASTKDSRTDHGDAPNHSETE